MNFRFADVRRIVMRRRAAIAVLAAVALGALAALAVIGASGRRADEAQAMRRAVAGAADRARAALDRQQRGLAQLADIAAVATDAAAQQFLDRLPALAPGIDGAAVADAAGTVQLRSAGGVATTVLATLAAEATREAAARPDAALLVTPTLRVDGAPALVGLARPWHAADGRLGGVALVAVGRDAFPGLALARSDGSPLFDADSDTAGQQVALADYPLRLGYRAATGGWNAWPFAALALLGAAALLGALALSAGRFAAARRTAEREAALAADLRDELAAIAAAASRSDEVSRAKSQFFAQVTHELRTPLNAIIGFSETIRQEIFGPVANPRYCEYAGLIHEAGVHLLSLINDLLDEARIEAGKMEIVPVRVAAAALAHSALDLVELLARDRDITIATAGLAGCPDLDVDLRAMKQVLLNLLSNAIKYTPPGGRIELRFAARDDGGAAIEIADTGIGMSAEDLRVAFEPFGRANAAETRRQQGTGLGLSLARALVRLHGGDLTLASRPGHGTTATVTLPACAVFGAARTAAARAA